MESKEALGKLKELFENLESRTQKPLSKITIANYVSKMNKLSNLVLGHNFSGNIEFLNDPKKVLKAIEDADVSGKKDYLSPVLRILKHNDANSNLIQAYQRGLSDFKNTEYAKRKKNKSKKEHIDASMPYDEIVEKIENFEPKDEVGLLHKVILSLYFLNSLVPRNDLNIVKLASASKKLKDLNINFNYILLDKEGTPVSMIWNKYKTNHTFGSVKFPIEPKVKNILKAYISLHKKQNGDLLFTKQNGKEMTKNDFLDLLKKATLNILGKEMGIDLIRQIQITNYFRNGVKSIEEDEKHAMRFLHGLNVHREYLRLDLKHESEGSGDEESENEK